MDRNQASYHSHYRVASIEYTKDGCCIVGVRVTNSHSIHQFKLSLYCHRMSWLKNFHHPDLETIWQLAKQQPQVTSFKRIITYCLVKFLMIKDTLNNWEEEAKRYLPGADHDVDDW